MAQGLFCRRLLTIRCLIIFGAISLSITFFMLVFSGDFNHHGHHRKLSAGNKARSEGVKHMSEFKNDDENMAKHERKRVLQKEVDVPFHKDTRPPLTVPRIVKYCNPPHSMEMGEEGFVSKDYTLINVHVVIRHGDRSPIAKLPMDYAPELSCLMHTTQHSHIPKVVNYVHVMAAASQKRPKDSLFNRWSLYPTHSACFDGQLTGRGAVQHILNGIHYSERYYHQLGLFDESNWDKKVVAHSTEVSRTFQSAIAFLYGLLPNFDIERLNLKSSSNINFCEERVFGTACTCLGIEAFRGKSRRECKVGERYEEVMKKYNDVQSHIMSVFGLGQKEVPYAVTLLDGLSPFACHNSPAPCNTAGECITTKSIEALWEPVDYETNCLNRNANYQKYAKAAMHGLLYRIAREMNIAIQNKSAPTFHLYSGHDTTVSPLISALELEDAVWPGYASRIVFELYHKRSTDEHLMRILQNGKVVTSEAVFCRDKTEDGFCRFTYFYHHITALNLQDFCESIKFTSRLRAGSD